jgi:hypothetical protein
MLNNIHREYYMALSVSHPVSTRDTNIILRALARGLIRDVIWKEPYNIMFIIYLNMRVLYYEPCQNLYHMPYGPWGDIGFSGWYGMWYRFWHVIFSIYQHNYVLVALTIFKIGGYQSWANILIFKQTSGVIVTLVMRLVT